MADRHVTHLLTRYAHGQLRPAQRARVVNHVRTCAACRAALAREEQLAADLRRQMPTFGTPGAGQLAGVWAGVWTEISAPPRPRRTSPGLMLLPGLSVALVMVLTLAIVLPLLASSGLRAEAALLQPRPASATPGATETNEASVYADAGPVDLSLPQATVAYAMPVGMTPAPVPMATVSPEARYPGGSWR